MGFGATHGAKARLSGYNFENIKVEGPVWRAFAICTEKNPWGGSDAGTIAGISFRNVAFTDAASTSVNNKMAGHVSNVAFHKLTMKGQVITSAKQGHFDLDAKTSGISFSAN